jgi:hypothetical protein
VGFSSIVWEWKVLGSNPVPSFFIFYLEMGFLSWGKEGGWGFKSRG